MDADTIRAGTFGRVFRLLTGLFLVFEGGRHLIGASWALVGMTAGVVLGELAFYALLHLIISRFFHTVNRWTGAILAVAPAAAAIVLGHAPGLLGTLLFVGISLLFTAVRGEGGCEVMTLPGMMVGRRTHLVCIAFSPIDWVEDRIAQKRSPTPDRLRGNAP